LKAVCRNRIHPEQHHLSADGNFSWEEAECLGACVNAPMVQIFKDTYEDLTPESFEKLIDDLAADKPVKAGPQNGRQFSMAEGGPTSLTDPELYSGSRKFTRVEPAAPVAAPPAPAAEVKPAPVPKPAPEVKAVEIANPQAPKPIKLEEQKVQPARQPVADKLEGAPELLTKPREGSKPDDLKLIRGVGPALEKLLNKMGVWHFDQIAAWTAKELKWVDERLEGFKGRASRDEWVKQSKKLATGWRPDSAVGEKPKKK
jgi:NADH-quinone oxidoreductase subunit E